MFHSAELYQHPGEANLILVAGTCYCCECSDDWTGSEGLATADKDQIVQLQHLGETPTCWLLTSNAARVCVALGLHNSSQFVLPSEELTEEQRELKNCFLWCYMFDKGLSMSLGRPVCMPVWDVPEDVIAPIEPDRPRSTVIQMLLKYAKIQAIISRDLYYQPTQLNSPQRKEAAIASLRRKMSKIQQQADEVHQIAFYKDSNTLIHRRFALVRRIPLTPLLRGNGSTLNLCTTPH